MESKSSAFVKNNEWWEINRSNLLQKDFPLSYPFSLKRRLHTWKHLSNWNFYIILSLVIKPSNCTSEIWQTDTCKMKSDDVNKSFYSYSNLRMKCLNTWIEEIRFLQTSDHFKFWIESLCKQSKIGWLRCTSILQNKFILIPMSHYKNFRIQCSAQLFKYNYVLRSHSSISYELIRDIQKSKNIN